MNAPVTAFYAAAGALLVLLLAVNVARNRRSRRIGLGDGGETAMTVAIRAHANAVETVPLAIVLLLLLELNGAPAILLHALGLLLIVARVLHAQGLLQHGGGVSTGRTWGTLGTWVGLAVMIMALPLLVLVRG